MKRIKSVDPGKKEYFQKTGTYPKRKEHSLFNKVVKYINSRVGDVVTNAEIRRATGGSSRRVCSILGRFQEAGVTTRVKRGHWSFDVSVPDFVTSDIIEFSNPGYGTYNFLGQGKGYEILQTSPKWKAGEFNPWIEWYDLNHMYKESENKPTLKPTLGNDKLHQTVSFETEGPITAINPINLGFEVRPEDESGTVQVFLEDGNSHFFPARDWIKLQRHVLRTWKEDKKSEASAKSEDNPRPSQMFKAEPGDLVYYIEFNKVCSARVQQIGMAWNETEKVVMYKTCHGEIGEDRVFISKEELIKSL